MTSDMQSALPNSQSPTRAELADDSMPADVDLSRKEGAAKNWLLALLLVLATFIVYYPAWKGEPARGLSAPVTGSREYPSLNDAGLATARADWWFRIV